MTEPQHERGDIPREVKDTVTIAWLAVVGPLSCACGHDHYGRTAQVAPDRVAGYPLVKMAAANLAPQWDRCEDPDCDCTALEHHIGTPPATSGGAS